MAEETKDPVRDLPEGAADGPDDRRLRLRRSCRSWPSRWCRSATLEASDTPLVEVVKAGAPGLPIEKILPFITMFAVSNTALINMLMASRLIYGMARQHVLPPVLGAVHPTRRARPWVAIMFTTLIAFGLIFYVTAFANEKAISVARRDDVAAAACGVRGRQRRGAGVASRRAGDGRPLQDADGLPVIGCLASLYLVTPLSGRPSQQYVLAGILVVIGIVLFFVTMAINRSSAFEDAGITDPTRLAEAPD